MRMQTIGLQGMQIPVHVNQQHGGTQQTIATVSMQSKCYIKKATHSFERCATLFQKNFALLSLSSFQEALQSLQHEFSAATVQLVVEFPYFIRKYAPVSKTPSLMEYSVRFEGNITQQGNKQKLMLGVTVPVTTLCPCSKEISDAGAHNQRAEVQLTITPKEDIRAEELITMIEDAASCQLYALLKRPDEKYVTERAYNTPMFVEDVVRKVSLQAQQHTKIDQFSVSVESFESIHKHNAYAYVDSDEA